MCGTREHQGAACTYQLLLRSGVLLLRLGEVLLVLVLIGLLGAHDLLLVLRGSRLGGSGSRDVGHGVNWGDSNRSGDGGVGGRMSGRGSGGEDGVYMAVRTNCEIKRPVPWGRESRKLQLDPNAKPSRPKRTSTLLVNIPTFNQTMEHAQSKIPVLLLKTKSAPVDLYEELFSACDGGRYAPVFVPVLEHRFNRVAVNEVRQHIVDRGFVPKSQQGLATYGALIFTSQRAVEAFAEVVEDLRREGSHVVDDLLPETLPLYVVGPATARGLRALNLRCPILGEETGIGDVLAALILEHYNSIYTGPSKPDILFLVGDKRRDIIPKTLQSEELGVERRMKVDERVIYETGEMHSFRTNFSTIWQENVKNGLNRQWVVVFSPTGCQAMLASLGLLDEATGKAKPVNHQKKDIFVATIGPTTRDYLLKEFDFSPDVCAEAPTPEGVIAGIQDFLQQHES